MRRDADCANLTEANSNKTLVHSWDHLMGRQQREYFVSMHSCSESYGLNAHLALPEDKWAIWIRLRQNVASFVKLVACAKHGPCKTVVEVVSKIT